MLPETSVARALLREASAELARLRRVRGAYKETARRTRRARGRLAFAAALLGIAPVGPALAGTPIFVSLSPNPGAVAFQAAPVLADIDGDGDFDAFIGDADGNVVFSANLGTPRRPGFAAATTNPFGLADVGISAAPDLVDIDGDGDLDAFVGNSDGNTVFFRNTGTPSAPAFAAPSSNPFGLADVGSYATPDFADVDGDGDADAFIGELTGNTIFFGNTGTASTPAFAAPSTSPFKVEYSASPALADVDGDGDLDALVGSRWSNAVTLFANTGTASAPAFAQFWLPGVSGASGGFISPAFADIDGDDDFDAFVGDFAGNVTVSENTGTVDTPVFSGRPLAAFGLGADGTPPTFVDIDADGDPDAFSLVGQPCGFCVSTAFELFRNTGTAIAPAFAAPSISPFGPHSLDDSASFLVSSFADIDGDGDSDAFTGRRFGSTTFFANTGSASAPAFDSGVGDPFGLESVGYQAAPAFADIDGDSDLDAFVGQRGGFGDASTPTLFFRNSGTASTPAFASPSTNPFGLADVLSISIPVLADIDGDGDLDAFVGEEYGDTIFFRNTGTANVPAFSTPATNPFGLAKVGSPAAPSFVDIDGDGDLDALIGWVFFENLEHTACNDEADNDVDGFIDFGSDPDCVSALDTSEGLERGACNDGLDNDADGAADYPSDPGCASAVDPNERLNRVCDDGRDNDGDGLTDFGSDPGCESDRDATENGIPVAICRDVSLVGEAATCAASASVDGGSTDPDDDALGVAQTPAGPYPLGTTPVTLQVSDPYGGQDWCQALVTVTDETPPVIDCGAALLTRGEQPPGIPWSAADECSLAFATATAPECFMVKRDGRRVERKCQPSAPGALWLGKLPKPKTHVAWTVTAVDASGNDQTQSCETVIGKRPH